MNGPKDPSHMAWDTQALKTHGLGVNGTTKQSPSFALREWIGQYAEESGQTGERETVGQAIDKQINFLQGQLQRLQIKRIRLAPMLDMPSDEIRDLFFGDL